MINRFARLNSQEIDIKEQKFVQVYIQFRRIGEIDTMNEKYQAEISIESKWIINEQISSYDPNKHWNPKLYIENAFQEPKETIKYVLSKDNENNNVVTEIRNVKGVFWERLELHNFPIDIQELSITIVSKLDPNEIKLVSDPNRLSHIDLDASHTFIDQQKWKLFKLVTISETASYDKGSSLTIDDNSSFDDENFYKLFKHSKIVATCYCARKAGYYIFNAYFLIFLITVSALTIFSIDPKLPQNRLQTTCTFLLTSVSFKWVINRSLPTISYLTSLDKYAIINIFFICVSCAWHAIVGAFWTKDEAREIDKWVLIGFGVSFILIHVGFIIWFLFAYSSIREIKKKETGFLKNFKDLKRDNYVKKILNTTRI